MNVLIFGLGMRGGGLASALYFLQNNDSVRVTDIKTADTFGKAIERLEERGCVCILGQHRKEDFLWADLVVKNPAISPDNPLLKYCKKVTNDLGYLFLHNYLQKIKIIAITGTKGKTTTSAAMSHVLKLNNHDVLQCGNMGISAFSLISLLQKRRSKGKADPEYLIIEFSSWQIRDTLIATGGRLPHFHLTIITNLMRDHQNFYANMQDYLSDKMGIFQAETGHAIVPKDLKKKVLQATGMKKKNVSTPDGKIPAQLASRPELIIAYRALCYLGLDSHIITEQLLTFKGVPHRIEWLGMKNNVAFVNDSAATIPEAVTFTIEHFSEKVVHLITGGTDKNLEAEGMLSALKTAATVSLLEGSFTKNKLIPLLEDNQIAYLGPFSSMKKAAKSCYDRAENNARQTKMSQILLLSPGAASFDLFNNEFDRGNQFKAFYNSLNG